MATEDKNGLSKQNKILLYVGIAVLAIAAIIFIIVGFKTGFFADALKDTESDVTINVDDNQQGTTTSTSNNQTSQTISGSDIPAYTGKLYIELNGNTPSFDKADMEKAAFENYSELDSLGRCGVAYAKLGKELMPTSDREDISSIHPTGWHHVEYDFVENLSLYNRSHLIAFSLAGENANEKNLITGTRFFNADGMEPFESMVADYIHETNNHVMYRVTPYFEGDNLVAKGVRMEAYSVEDDGAGICFDVFVYNVQPGVYIDYATGDSHEAEGEIYDIDGDGVEDPMIVYSVPSSGSYFVLNTYTMKFHYSNCESVAEMSNGNKAYYEGTSKELMDMGYKPCGSCKPDR